MVTEPARWIHGLLWEGRFLVQWLSQHLLGGPKDSSSVPGFPPLKVLSWNDGKYLGKTQAICTSMEQDGPNSLQSNAMRYYVLFPT